jgi:pyroglutamyl-peptidase
MPEKGVILLTGYEPFGEFKRNSSIEACRKLEGMVYREYRVVVEEITMDFSKVQEVIEGHIENYKPSAVICTGVSGGGSGLAVERIAVNVSTALPPRWEGDEEPDKPLREGGPAGYFTTLPYRKLLEALKDAKIPSSLSGTAGTVGCNQIFYHTMDYLARNSMDIPAGFIHVPRLPEQAVDGRRASMDVKTGARGLEAVVDELAKNLP